MKLMFGAVLGGTVVNQAMMAYDCLHEARRHLLVSVQEAGAENMPPEIFIKYSTETKKVMVIIALAVLELENLVG